MSDKIKFKPKNSKKELEIPDEYYALYQALEELTNSINLLRAKLKW